MLQSIGSQIVDTTEWLNNNHKPRKGFPDGSIGRHLPAVQETQVQFLGLEDPLEKGVATHSSIPAWRIHGQWSLVGYSP